MKKSLPTPLQGKRYAYIKHGDVIAEIEILTGSDDNHYGGGLTYVRQFYDLFGSEKALLLSTSSAMAKGLCHNGNWQARGTAKKRTSSGFTISERFRSFFLFYWWLRSFRPDVIVCASYRASLWASFCYHKMFSVPLIHTRHNILAPGHGIMNRVMAWVDNLIIPQIPFVICHGDSIRQELLDIGVKPKHIAMFRASYRQFLTAAGAETVVHDFTAGGTRTVIFFAGRFIRAKGVFDLFTACRERLQNDPTLCLVYCGGGRALEELQNVVAEAGLEDQVFCLGWVSHAVLARTMLQSRFVVSPSHSSFPEGFPKSAVEPLVLGKPVVAPDYGPFSFIHHEQNGLIFASDNPDSLKKNILRLLDDNSLYDHLVIGAKKTGKELIDPPLTFAEALLHGLAHLLPPEPQAKK